MTKSRFMDGHVANSRCDSQKVSVIPTPYGCVAKPVQFIVDASNSSEGNLEIAVNARGLNVPTQVHSMGGAKFGVTFTPTEACEHAVSVTFNNEPVVGSPFTIVVTADATKAAQVSVSGQALHFAPIEQTAQLTVHNVVYERDLAVKIEEPTGQVLLATLKPEPHQQAITVEFYPLLPGEHLIHLSYKGQPLPGSPFSSKVYDIRQIRVKEMPSEVCIGKPVTFLVEAANAGPGNLELIVNNGKVPSTLQALGPSLYAISFVPKEAEPHVIEIKFNGESIEGAPFVCKVLEAGSRKLSVRKEGLERIPVQTLATFGIDTFGGDFSAQISIVSPSQQPLEASASGDPYSGYSVSFTPIEVGDHLIDVKVLGESVAGCPFVVKAYDAKNVKISDIRNRYASVAKPVQFVVDASNSGEGNLEIAVNAKGLNVPTQVHSIGGAKFGVTFTPTEVCEHVVSVTFNNESVVGSPFTIIVTADLDKVSVSGQALHFAPIEQTAVLTVHNIGNERELVVKIEEPNGLVLPATLKQEAHHPQAVTIEFYPLQPGEHLIHLSYKGQPLPGSPFSSKVYDIRQIRVKEMPSEVYVGKAVTFLVEAANAGPGNLEVIVNSGKVPSTPQALGPSLYAISFIPKEAEPHVIEIKFNGEPIEGAPFICKVLDSSKLSVRKEGLERIPIQALATFGIDTFGGDFSAQISIVGPNQQPLEASASGDPYSGYSVSFTPVEVGDHLIDVKVLGESVAGCPFVVKAYDAKNVKISDISTGSVGKPVFFSIDASQAGAGNLEIIVSVNGRNVPNYVQSEGNAKFRVNFKPLEAAAHVVSVKFNGEPVPGSPYQVPVQDNSQSLMSGQSLKMASLSKKIEFSVENKSDAKECKVLVTSPSGKKLKASVTKAGGQFQVSFAASEVGPHQILVLLDGTVLGGPVSCNVYDVEKVKVRGLSNSYVGKALTFQVDASQAGEGTLELVVTTRKSSVRAEVLMRSRGMYDVTFVAQEKVPHYVNITFNEENVPGSPFKIEVKEAGAAEGSLLRPSGRTADEPKTSTGLLGTTNISSFDWPGSEADSQGLEVKVTGPHGQPVPAIGRLERSKLIVEYTPRDTGLYKIEAFDRGQPALKRPHLVEVCDPSRVRLINVQDGVVGREQSFKIDCTRAGRGDLSILIKCNDKEVKHAVKELSSGVFAVSYVPRQDLAHLIDVRYNGYHAPGSPSSVDIRDPSQSIIIHGPALRSCMPGSPATFLIETGGFAAAKDFDVIVTDPGGAPLPVKCYQQKDGSLLTEFQPTRTGAHKIDVLYLDSAVPGSPFQSECFDAGKIRLQQTGSSQHYAVNQPITFALDRKEAGYAELDVTVTSPLGRHLPIEVKGTADGDGELIEFVPAVAGKYKIAITFGGIEVPGSPVTFLAQESNVPQAEGSGLRFGRLGETSTFQVSSRGLVGTLDVRVSGPDSECDVTVAQDDGLYTVSFVPDEVGSFDVRLLWNGREISGSPFHPAVVDLSRVQPIGGWESLAAAQSGGKLPLQVGEAKKITFDTLGAGPGKLRATVKGPSGQQQQDVQVEPVGGSTKYRLSFVPATEGEYYLSLYYGDHLVPKSPLVCTTAATSAGNAQLAIETNGVGAGASECATVVLRGHGLAGARVGEETEFVIDGTDSAVGVPEKIEITLTGVKADIPIKVTQLSPKVFKATYTPSVQGTYLLNVLWAGKQVKGCPLKVSILARCDASRVFCTGDGLKGGVLGKDIKAFIDTKRAGPGELTAHCVGPQKVAYCELYDQMDGTFTLFLKPQEGGKHTLTVKYGGEHVSGSPFTVHVRVASAPDASKVRVYGPGIEHGVLPLYQSRFICDTRGAGAGQLTVRIRGPKGAFRVEMQRESQKERTILCKYDPTEPGDYRIEVRWSGQHVPGSPFAVMIFDTQDELSRYLFSQSRNSHSPSSLVTSGPKSALVGPGSEHYFGGTQFMAPLPAGHHSWRGSSNNL